MGIEAGEGEQPFPPDSELVARLRGRDETAFVLMVGSWSGGLLRLARHFVSTNDSAAEVVQDTWLAVIHGLDSFEGRSSLKTWVCRILVNTAKRRGVREGRTIPWSSLPVAQDQGPTVDPARFLGPESEDPGHWRVFPQPWPMPSPEQEAVAKETRAVVEEALTHLPDRQRIVITLRDVEGYNAEEVCSILELSAANQRVLLHRARAFVRGRLEEYFAGAKAAADGG
ncbi:RNA polymerase sigma factor [Kibdelosporangium persicum]|uniref:RNA polymerase sigma factor RpoE n=1 Tax=Kibdelosporangium persicum TaxID=2698649 RepID=A0ABX2EV67_9PSEU|nr:sigma-70 family RNA polymerase sigma factor [Kibdelosporangium persicum]NRN62859.1 RNA polymerase sigma factor RpoE [Kibdelosporangium persicum]